MAVYNEVPTKDYAFEENGNLRATRLLMGEEIVTPRTEEAGSIGQQQQQKQSKTRALLYNLKPLLFLLILILYSLLGGLIFYFIEYETAKEMYVVDLEKNKQLLSTTADYIYSLIDLSKYIDRLFSNLSISNDSFASFYYDEDIDSGEISRSSGSLTNCSYWLTQKFKNQTDELLNATIVLPFEELTKTLTIFKDNIIRRDSRDIGDWTFWGSVFYAGTVYSTIGYGNIIPHTVMGRVMTICYAILGIPTMLFTLAQMGKLFCNGILHLYLYVTYTFCRCVRRDPKKKIDPIADFPLSLAFLVTFGWMCLCAGIFCAWETNWDFFISFYFFFQSLTTIGLGDVTPKHMKHMLSGFMLIIVGMSLVSMCLNLIQLKLERFINDMIESIRARYLQAELKGDELGHDPEVVASEIKKIASAQSAFLSAVMTDIGKERLVGEWQKKAALCNVGVQVSVKTKEIGVGFHPEMKTETTQSLPPILPHTHQNKRNSNDNSLSSSTSPSHSLEVPYMEHKRRSTTNTTSDDFRMKLKELGFILNECNSIVRDMH